MTSAPTQRPRRGWVRRPLTLAVSLGLHAAVLVLLFRAWDRSAPAPEPPVVELSLIDLQNLLPPKPTPSPAPPAQTPPRIAVVHETRLAHPHPAPAPGKTAVDVGPGLSAAELAGAGGPDGGGGGVCNMARRLQDALRGDRLVQQAAATFQGKAILIWNGGWIRARGEDGAGLAAIREAVMWEIAFAPEACRSQRVHGLMVIPAGGSARLAMGAADWTWADMVTRQSGPAVRP